ncbi:MAG: Crp/Fnr family transcriptional regulator [Gallionellaceae bacterium]|nr:Crp/Fnr family transcriptional regulator [Gallionellaceae bacterium]
MFFNSLWYDLNHINLTQKHRMDWRTLIASQPALARIPPQLRILAERREIDAGETLFRIGDRVQSVFSVISGEVRLIRRDRNGTEVILQRSHGGFFAEASLGNKTYHCDVVATKKGAVLRFPAKAFRAALDEDANFRDAWMTHLAREVRKLRAQCERLSLHNAADRIVHYIESEGTNGAITLNQSRKDWATELGLTHEALYRALRRLQADGTLYIDGDLVAIAQTN